MNQNTHRQGLEEIKFSQDDWCNLLSISHRYECEGARERAIKEINKLVTPVSDIDKIAMAEKYGVEEWLLPACVALAERGDPLTYAEADKLGMGMTVLVGEAREKYIGNEYDNYSGQPKKATQIVKGILGIK